MDPRALTDLLKSTNEFQAVERIGSSLQNLAAITAHGCQVADYVCALVPDALIEKYGVNAESARDGVPPSLQLRLSRGYEVHLFPSGDKHLMSNDGTQRYLNADFTPEVGWCGPSPSSILMFTIDVASGLIDEVQNFVCSFPAMLEQ